MVSIEAYLKDPCGVSSIPYWKTREITVPDHMMIVHHRDYIPEEFTDFTDTPYFRLIHRLEHVPVPSLPSGYSVCNIGLQEFATHINSCYRNIGTSEAELRRYTTRKVFTPSLWIAVTDDRTGAIVATGIGELDPECREGALEWIQVSESHRRRGLGSWVVSELLSRMMGKAAFVTVSGQCNDPSQPERLYRKCGFTGDDVWHILNK